MVDGLAVRTRPKWPILRETRSLGERAAGAGSPLEGWRAPIRATFSGSPPRAARLVNCDDCPDGGRLTPFAFWSGAMLRATRPAPFLSGVNQNGDPAFGVRNLICGPSWAARLGKPRLWLAAQLDRCVSGSSVWGRLGARRLSAAHSQGNCASRNTMAWAAVSARGSIPARIGGRAWA